MSDGIKFDVQVREHGNKFCIVEPIGYGVQIEPASPQKTSLKYWTGSEWSYAKTEAMDFDTREQAAEHAARL